MLHTKLTGNHEMQQHGGKYFAHRRLPDLSSPPPDPVVGVKRSKFNFSEQGHDAYQVKENHKCSNMVANICRIPPTQPLEWDQ